MPLDRPRFRRRRLSLTSLIDVILLLLLFFMLSSTFSRHGEISLFAATGGTGAPSGTPPLFLRLDEGDLSLNGTAITLADLLPALRDRIGAEPAPVLILSVGAEVTSQALVDVMVPLGQVRGATVIVVD
jgi:biopolymer transport protein ExbD